MTHGEFNTLIRNRYRSMQTRFGPRFSKRGRVIRPGQHIPFTVNEYQQWHLEQLGGTPTGRAECVYCHHKVGVEDLEADHRVAPSQGGSLGFDNLVPACAPCNKQKGEMTDMGFHRLLDLLNQPNFREVDRTNILGRLQRETKFLWGAKRRPGKSNTVRLNPAGRIRLPAGH